MLAFRVTWQYGWRSSLRPLDIRSLLHQYQASQRQQPIAKLVAGILHILLAVLCCLWSLLSEG